MPKVIHFAKCLMCEMGNHDLCYGVKKSGHIEDLHEVWCHCHVTKDDE